MQTVRNSFLESVKDKKLEWKVKMNYGESMQFTIKKI